MNDLNLETIEQELARTQSTFERAQIFLKSRQQVERNILITPTPNINKNRLVNLHQFEQSLPGFG